jgi:hypothetical protein
LATGLLVIFFGSAYQLGNLTYMGPGFVPVLLGGMLVLLAALILWSEPEQSIRVLPLQWRPPVFVAAGMLAWALLAEPAGFFVASCTQLLLSCLALPNAIKPMVIIGILMTSGICYLLFVGLLGLPLAAIGR